MHQNEITEATAELAAGRRSGVVTHVIDGRVLKVLEGVFAGAHSGRLHVVLPSGRSAVFGSTDSRGIEVSIALKNYRVFWASMRRGALGFADSYLSGDFEVDSLANLFRFYMDNEAILLQAYRRFFHSSRIDRLFHQRRANTRAGSRANIAAHYDLGNDFYRLWLDEGMTYSSGIYRSADVSLEAAQDEKYARIHNALELGSDHSVLEIGCGWGGFAESAALKGADVTAVTISRNQFEDARARIARRGLQDRANIVFEDYRDTLGQFDRVASIEMIEAVGEENWQAYFRTVADRLKPGGVAAIQAITIREDLYDLYRRSPDFIQRYIFPGGMLPTVSAMRRHANEAGLSFDIEETFADSYARTLAAWRDRFVDAWPRVEALGFDERFRRMWMYYLDYCEVGFESGTIDVGLYRMNKPL